MRFDLKEDKLVLYLEGELNSYNAEGVEKEIGLIRPIRLIGLIRKR